MNPDGTLTAKDFFSPSNGKDLDANDQDLGSGGPIALPDSFGTPAHPHLVVQDGKDGRIFLLDRDNLGGADQGPGGTDAALGVTGPFGGLWGHPAAWPGGGGSGTMYLVDSYGYLRAFGGGVDSSGVPTLSLIGQSQGKFPYTSGSPVITSNGTTPGSGVVWVIYASGPAGTSAQLRAYSATPSGAILNQLWSSPIGTASKFSVPATNGGRVYVATRDGHVFGFGRPAAVALQTTPVNFGNVALGSTASSTAHVVASKAVTITAISTVAPFSVTPPTLPVVLSAGQALDIPVTFNPTTLGQNTQSLTLAVTGGSFSLSLTGQGTFQGIAPNPALIDFGTVPTGVKNTLTTDITNYASSAETITGVTAPTGDFSSSSLPSVGQIIAPGASITVPVTYAPSSAGTVAGSLVVQTADSTATVTLAGAGETGVAHMTLAPTQLDFGNVPLGSSKTLSFVVSDTGNIPMTITKAKAPSGDFLAAFPLGEGQLIDTDTPITQQVVYTPSALGPNSGTYQITSDDGQGALTVTLTGTGIAAGVGGSVPDPSLGGWTVNGAAVVGAGGAVLTPAVTNKAGSVVWPTPVASSGLDVTFTSVIGGGTGADGLALVLLDPAHSTPSSLGVVGSGLGFGGLTGLAVALDTHQGTGNPSANFVGVSDGALPSVAKMNVLHWLATSSAIGKLRTGSHVVHVVVSGGQLVVSVDGVQVINVAVTLPPSVLIGFSGGTGGSTDVHTISNTTIITGGGGGSGPGDTTAPTVPSNVHVTATTSTSGSLAWSASTDAVGVAGYRVYSGTTVVATATPSTSPAATVNGLTPLTAYPLTVTAYDAAGNESAMSAIVTVTTTAGADTTPPTPPTNVQQTCGDVGLRVVVVDRSDRRRWRHGLPRLLRRGARRHDRGHVGHDQWVGAVDRVLVRRCSDGRRGEPLEPAGSSVGDYEGGCGGFGAGSVVGWVDGQWCCGGRCWWCGVDACGDE